MKSQQSTDLEQIAKEKYESHVSHLEGHHCPTWEGLSDAMKAHLIWLAANQDSSQI